MKSAFNLAYIIALLFTACNPLSTEKVDLAAKKLEAAADCTPDNGFSGIKTVENVLVDGHFKKIRIAHEFQPVAGGFEVIPHVGLRNWASFTTARDSTMLMGYLVIGQRDFNRTQKQLESYGLMIQDLHPYAARDGSVVMFIHLIGFGTAGKVSENISSLLSNQSQLQRTPVSKSLNTNNLDSIIAHPGKWIGNLYHFSIEKSQPLTSDGATAHSLMKDNTWAVWQGTDEFATVAGNFTMRDGEVAPVLQALAEHGIESVYNHLIAENPDIFSLHYWGAGNPEQLAKGIRAALNKRKL